MTPPRWHAQPPFDVGVARGIVALLVAAGIVASCAAPSISPSATPLSPTLVPGSPSTTPTASSAGGPTSSPTSGEGIAITSTVSATVSRTKPTPPLSAVAFADPRHGWAGGEGLILATHDGGSTWQPSWAGPFSVRAITTVDRAHAWALVAPPDPAATATELLRTLDGGAHWAVLHPPAQLRSVTFTTPQVGWAIGGPTTIAGPAADVYAPGVLLSSVDGGATWHDASLAPKVDAICFAGQDEGWAAVAASVYHSADGGRIWVRVHAGPASITRLHWIAEHVACAGSAAWVLWSGGGAMSQEAYLVERTLDAGAHWQTVLGEPYFPVTPPDVGTIDAYAGSFALAAAAAGGFVGWCPACGLGTYSYTRTLDGGRSFSHQSLAGLDGGRVGDLTFADPQHAWIAATRDGGEGVLLASTDGGRTWREAYPSSTPHPALDIAFVSATVGFGLGMIGDGTAILRTDDAGTTWQLVGQVPGDALAGGTDQALSFVDERHGWAATAAGLFATTDGGLTWQAVRGAASGGVAFASLADGCTGAWPTGASTTDGGRSWQPADVSHGVAACAAAIAHPAWATAAIPFAPNAPPTLGAIVGSNDAWAFDFADALTGRIEVLATADGGRSWTAYRWPAPAPDSEVGVNFADRLAFAGGEDGWLLTLGGQLFRTQDGGASWTQLGTS